MRRNYWLKVAGCDMLLPIGCRSRGVLLYCWWRFQADIVHVVHGKSIYGGKKWLD